MSRPNLYKVVCCAGEQDYSLHCRCNCCISRPSLYIQEVDKNMTKREIMIVFKKLCLGEIREIDIEVKKGYQDVSIYFNSWNGNDHIREILQKRETVKFHFNDAYGEHQTLVAKQHEKEPRYFNSNWENDVSTSIELPAAYLDLHLPTSCTPRADGKSEEEVLKERKERELYYYAKNIYQTYDLNRYDEMIQKYGEGYVWEFNNNSKERFLEKFLKRKIHYKEVYLQQNWISQITIEKTFWNRSEYYEVVKLSPTDRPIKDRVYEPARKKMMLDILANWSEVGCRPYWLCSGLTTILDDRNEYSTRALQKFIPDNKKSSNINVISGIGALQLSSERTNKYTYKYTLIYKKIERWARMMKVPTFITNEIVPAVFSKIKAHSPYVISTWNEWSFNLSPFQLKLQNELLQLYRAGGPLKQPRQYSPQDNEQLKERVMEQTFYFKDIVMEELNARFWFCVERKSLINVDNLVGSTGESRYNLAKQAKEYYNTLYNSSKKIEDYQTTDIPQEFSPYEQQDCWCNCGKVNECQECRDHTPCYSCYFCNRVHAIPREWNRWQELYNTVPRCTCQYRIISQERLQEVRDNPDKFNRN